MKWRAESLPGSCSSKTQGNPRSKKCKIVGQSGNQLMISLSVTQRPVETTQVGVVCLVTLNSPDLSTGVTCAKLRDIIMSMLYLCNEHHSRCYLQQLWCWANSKSILNGKKKQQKILNLTKPWAISKFKSYNCNDCLT